MMLATAVLSLLPLAAPAAAKPAEQKWDMTTFTLVLVRPGKPDAGAPPDAAEAHRTLLRDLVGKGKAIAWGSIEGSPELLEVIVLDVPKPEEARPLLASDPWFTSGARVMELHPWFAARGILNPPPEGAARETITFGLLRRPPDAPQYPEDKLKEIQKGHMANIEAMAASGDLAIAGPLADDGTLRGVFVFRGKDEKHLRAIAARDAAIQAGRLVLDLYTWEVPAGTLPAKAP